MCHLESWLNLHSLLFPKLASFIGRRHLGNTPDANYNAQGNATPFRIEIGGGCFMHDFQYSSHLLLAMVHYTGFRHDLPAPFDISGASFPQKILLWTLLALTRCPIPWCRWIHICIISIFHNNVSVGWSHQQ